jgi:hypothetical protein
MRKRTIIEDLQLVTSLLCIVHALKQWVHSGILLTPEVVGEAQSYSCHCRGIDALSPAKANQYNCI